MVTVNRSRLLIIALVLLCFYCFGTKGAFAVEPSLGSILGAPSIGQLQVLT